MQFIHRGLAYILFILTIIWWMRAKKIQGGPFFNRVKIFPPLLIFLQLILGIFTVTLSPYGDNLVWFGVAHQLVAMLFLMSMVLMMYLVRKRSLAI